MKFLMILVFWCIGLVNLMLQGYVLSTLWGWFLVKPLGLPALEVVPAIGLTLIVSLLVARFREPKKDKQEDLARNFQILLFGFIYPLMVFGTGWLVNLCM